MWMGLLLVGLAPMAEPAGVVAFVAPGATTAAVEAAIVAGGLKARNVTSEHEQFGTLSALALGNLDVAAPGFWPKALQKDWDEGISLCKSVAGGPPYNPSNRMAFMCGQDATAVLWQRYLDHLNPAKVLILSASEGENGAVNVGATLFAPGETAQKADERKVAKADTAKSAGLMTTALLGGNGKAGTREVARNFPRIYAGDDAWLKAGVPAPVPPVAFPGNCARPVPETLVLTPADSAIAQNVSSLWKASIAGHEDKGKAMTCSLKVFVGATGIMGVSDLRAQVPLLTCGGAQLTAKSAPGISMAPVSVQASMAKQIVTTALQAACK